LRGLFNGWKDVPCYAARFSSFLGQKKLAFGKNSFSEGGAVIRAI
jgi:hypothetical protein